QQQPTKRCTMSTSLAAAAEAARTPIIYHMCPQSAWDEVKHEPTGTYVPEGFDKVGFIHCTSIATGLLNVANHFYKGSKEAWICLEIDAAACAPAKVIWEPPAP
ncbi:unnamed protein product, partial [Polarella glacialis]